MVAKGRKKAETAAVPYWKAIAGFLAEKALAHVKPLAAAAYACNRRPII